MLGSLIHKMEKFSRIAGVELLNSSEGVVYRLVVLERKKDLLSIVERSIHCKTIQELTKQIDKETPIVLSVDGKGVLHKAISAASTNRIQQLGQVLPNASLDDFHLQIVSSTDGPIASIIRLDQLRSFLDQFEANELSVVELILGPFHLQHIAETIQVSEYNGVSGKLTLQSGKIVSWSASNKETTPDFSLGDDRVDGLLLIAVANALKGIVLPKTSSEMQPQFIQSSRSEYLYRQLFRKMGMGLLPGFLGLLLINFLAFQHFFTSNSELESQLFVQRSQLIKLDTLKSQHQRQQKLFNQYSLTKSSRISFYADRLASSMPTDIQLDNLTLFPSKKRKQQSGKPSYLFEQDRILISGFSKSCLVVNSWVQGLEGVDWVQEAKIVHCGVGDDGVLGFELAVGI